VVVLGHYTEVGKVAEEEGDSFRVEGTIRGYGQTWNWSKVGTPAFFGEDSSTLDTLYVPEVEETLLSVEEAEDCGWVLRAKRNAVTLTRFHAPNL
jgi:hypothetical protein